MTPVGWQLAHMLLPGLMLQCHDSLSQLAIQLFSSPEPGELIVYQSSRRRCVCACVRPLTLSNMIISVTSRPIGMKFYLKHHWGGGKGFSSF